MGRVRGGGAYVGHIRRSATEQDGLPRLNPSQHRPNMAQRNGVAEGAKPEFPDTPTRARLAEAS